MTDKEGRMTTVRCQSADLYRAINLVKHAVAAEDARPILTTILFEGDADGFRLVAADNYRIAVAEIEEASGDVGDWGRRPIPLSELKPLLPILKAEKGEVRLSLETDGRRAHLAGTDWGIDFRVMDGTFPGYRAVLPNHNGHAAVALNAKYLRDAFTAAQASETGISVLHVGDPLVPIEITVKSVGYREIVMPVRVPEDSLA